MFGLSWQSIGRTLWHLRKKVFHQLASPELGVYAPVMVSIKNHLAVRWNNKNVVTNRAPEDQGDGKQSPDSIDLIYRCMEHFIC